MIIKLAGVTQDQEMLVLVLLTDATAAEKHVIRGKASTQAVRKLCKSSPEGVWRRTLGQTFVLFFAAL